MKNSSWFLIVTVLLVSACLPLPYKPQITSLEVPVEHVALLSSRWQADFTYNAELKTFIGGDGQTAEAFIKDVESGQVISLRGFPRSNSAVLAARDLISRYGHRLAQSKVFPQSTNAFEKRPYELRFVGYHYGLQISDCYQNSEFYVFGCSVDINRALSLANYRELAFGRTLAVPSGRLETSPLDAKKTSLEGGN